MSAPRRQGTTLGRFLCSSVALGPLGARLAVDGLATGSATALLLGTMALLLGPGVVIAQLARRARGEVVMGAHDLAIGQQERLSWSQLTGAEHLPSPRERLPRIAAIGDWLAGFPRPSEIIRRSWGFRGIAVLVGGLVGVALAPLVLAGYFVAPALALVTPWHDRVLVTGSGGARWVLHDLDDPAGFVAEVRARLEGHAHPRPDAR